MDVSPYCGQVVKIFAFLAPVYQVDVSPNCDQEQGYKSIYCSSNILINILILPISISILVFDIEQYQYQYWIIAGNILIFENKPISSNKLLFSSNILPFSINILLSIWYRRYVIKILKCLFQTGIPSKLPVMGLYIALSFFYRGMKYYRSRC